MGDQQDDMVVIQQVLQGRQAAYAILVERYQRYVFTLVLRYVPNREVAEELAQDVFIKAYRCLADFKGSSKFSTWLYTIVNTTCLSYLRKKPDATVLLEEERMITIADRAFAETPLTKMEQQARQRMISIAMQQLHEDEARILSLYYQGDQSVDEIGVITGLTASNVKVKLYRARQKLKGILAGKVDS
ncbi:MAG: sigma-70 family RNA polymerase sigma factor [Bacteroidota bacterium]